MLVVMMLACAGKQTLEFDGVEREYILHLPDDLPEEAPLVLFLHGYGGKARTYSWLGMKKQADELGFAVVFPQGSRDQFGTTHWNAQLDISDTDDIGFLTALAQDLQEQHGLSPARTYTSGISNGGFMSYALVCQAPEVFAAAGSVIGTMSGETWETCPDHPVPIIQMSGTEDDVVPMDGSMDAEEGWGGAPEMDAVIERWVAVNGCTGSESIAVDDDDTDAVRYTDCTDDAEVAYYVVEGMGHNLPPFEWQAALSSFLLAH